MLLIVRRGALGLIMGPLELVGTLGNVLSYLRLAAVGLASAYLAMVANELAVLGPLWMGIFVGVFFHALNLALAVVEPDDPGAPPALRRVLQQVLRGRRAAVPALRRARRLRSCHNRQTKEDDMKEGLMALGAGLAVGLGAIGTGFAQARIGAAAMAAIAEKPELTGRAILMVAIPETLVILGFAVAAMIIVLL